MKVSCGILMQTTLTWTVLIRTKRQQSGISSMLRHCMPVHCKKWCLWETRNKCQWLLSIKFWERPKIQMLVTLLKCIKIILSIYTIATMVFHLPRRSVGKRSSWLSPFAKTFGFRSRKTPKLVQPLFEKKIMCLITRTWSSTLTMV